MKRFNSILKLCFMAGVLVNPIAAAAGECGTLKSLMTNVGEFFNDNWGYDECKQKTEEFKASGRMDDNALKPEPDKPAKTEADKDPDKSAVTSKEDSISLPGASGTALAEGKVGAFSFLDSMKTSGWAAPKEKLIPKSYGYLTDGKGNVVFIDDQPLSNDTDRYELIFSKETGELFSVNDNHRQMSIVPWMVSTKPINEVPLVLKTRDYDDYDWDALPAPTTEVSAADLSMTPSTNLPPHAGLGPQPNSGDTADSDLGTEGEADKPKKESSPYTDDDPGTLGPVAKKACAEGPIRIGVHSMACIDEYNRAQAEKGKAAISSECGSDFIGPLLPGQCETSEQLPSSSEMELDDSDKLPFSDDDRNESTAQTMDKPTEEIETTEEAVASLMNSKSDEEWLASYESPVETAETDEKAADNGVVTSRFWDPNEPVAKEEGDDDPLSKEDEDWFAKVEKEAKGESENNDDVLVNAPDLNVNPTVAETDAGVNAKSADELDLSAEDIKGEKNTPWSNMADDEKEKDVFALSDSEYSVESLEKMDRYVRDNITVVEAQSLKDKETGVHVRSVVAISSDGSEEMELMGHKLEQKSQKLHDMRDSEIENIVRELGVSEQQIEECKNSMANRDSTGHLEHLTDVEAIRKCLTNHIMLFSDELVITQDQYLIESDKNDNWGN